MQDCGEASSSSSQRRGGLPALAPRTSPTSLSRNSLSSSSGRPARLSHRSRAGCWTCRGRKVKCDELRPKCGPCTRLNRECDWDHRWNFSDATSTTQGKHTNVTTTGNAVWDPIAPQESIASPTRRWDDLPAFATLTTDEDRERKAETHLPGTFAVVATPESFFALPEYATASGTIGRRQSVQSGQSSVGSPVSLSEGSLSRPDPNTVLLDRFEDASQLSAQRHSVSPPASGPSIPEALLRLSIATPPQIPSTPSFASPVTRVSSPSDRLITHFRQHIARRLVQPVIESQTQQILVQGSTRDVFEIEAARFRPLHHAMCAISALNLSCTGRVSLEEALQHYQSALGATVTPTTPDDLLSDAVFLRHFLLFVYDICVPTEADNGGDVMWAQHLNHLRSIALQRHQRFGKEPLGFILWFICELDLHACLLGSGSCEFVGTVLQNNMLPPIDQQVPGIASHGSYSSSELHVLPMIQRLNEGVMLNLVKLAQLAQQCRTEAAGLTQLSPGVRANWQANVSRVQTEIMTFWSRMYPGYLAPESPQAGYNLPVRAKHVFEHAFLLFQTSVIYSRTSMFPGQRTIPVANGGDVHTDSERRCLAILAVASRYIEQGSSELRHVIFPLFMAGLTTKQPDAKTQAINAVKAMDSGVKGGIGQNTFRTRQLLEAVCGEQRRVVSMGGRMEEVDWLTVARARGLSVVNCGL